MALPPENSKPATMKQMTTGPLTVVKLLIDSFSAIRQREPPYKGKKTHIRLITISPSHFCEKVRWALVWEFSGPTSDVQTIPTQDIMTSSVGCHPLVSPWLLFISQLHVTTYNLHPYLKSTAYSHASSALYSVSVLYTEERYYGGY